MRLFKMTHKIDFYCLQRQYENPQSQDFKKIKLIDGVIQTSNKLLDIGSGTGAFINLVKNKFQSIYSIEQDPVALLFLQENFSSDSKIKIIQASINDYLIKTPSLSFDYITCLDVLEHLSFTECQITIKELYKQMKPGGFLIISVPGIFEKIRIFLGKSPTHRHSHSSYGWVKILQHAGFKILTIQTVEFPLIDHILFRKFLHLFGKCCVIVAEKPLGS